MALRHPERLGPNGEYESDPPSPRVNPETAVHDVVGDLAEAPGRAGQPQKKQHACDKPPVILPFTTDFGPNTLSDYLRSASERLAQPSPTDKGKGKEKEVNTTDPDHSCRGDPSQILRTSISELTHASDPDGGSFGKDLPSGASKDGASAAWVDLRECSSSQQGSRQSLKAGPRLQSSAGLSDITNSQNNLTTLSSASLTGMRRSKRLALNESSPRDDSHGESGRQAGPAPPMKSASTKQSRGGSQLAVPPSDGGSKETHSGAQSVNESDHAAIHTSESANSDLLRRSNFEQHTKTKRQVVRAKVDQAPQTVEDINRQLRKKTRQNKASESPGISPSLVNDAPCGSAVASLHAFQSSRPPFPVPDSTSSNINQSVVSSSSSTDQCPNEVVLTTGGNLQNATLETSDKLRNLPSERPDENPIQTDSVTVFDYSAIVPEHIPESEKQKFFAGAQRDASSSSTDTDLDNDGDAPVATLQRRREPRGKACKKAVCTHASYPRVWAASKPDCMSAFPSDMAGGPHPLRTATFDTFENFNSDLWAVVARYLSTEDLKRLRLVNKAVAHNLEPLIFRNVVVNFGKGFFDVCGGQYDSEGSWSPSKPIFKKYGPNINQFGIAFEYDLNGLCQAKPKVIEKRQTAWFGSFIWPTEQYPRFPALQEVEDLVDHNRPLLKETFKHITKASELGLCIDSGHGWLEGPDISDLALFNQRLGKGSKVFGKTFTTEDSWTMFARDEYFRWAQQNTINETMKHLLEHRTPEQASAVQEMQFLEGIEICNMESFRSQEQQPDYDPDSHVGCLAGTNPQNLPNIPLALIAGWMQANAANIRRSHRDAARRQGVPSKQPQWPLVFNGHNLAAEVGGHCAFVQAKTGHPANSPLLPGNLTEAQAQWLMETVWAQRAFLSAYTTAVITNKQNFASIHSVRISKLSSGLLPSLEQSEFWSSLPGLKHLQILIKPDWRQEHCIGDRFHSDNMPISPAKAAEMLTRFLRTYVVKIERLHSLTVGYAAGGEHAVGMFARNQHVLPAPIVIDPAPWLHRVPNRSEFDITKFDHIRELKFENCWFSPYMLQDFMNKSKDTSLHSLILDSVSLTTYHDATLERPLTTTGDNLRCQYEPWNWWREILPVSAAWCRVLDSMTPGCTLLERKHQLGYRSRDTPAPPKRSFRGHVQKIVLNSCGYVKITVPKEMRPAFKQNAAVTHFYSPMDSGLRARKERFTTQPSPAPTETTATVAGIRVRLHRPANNQDADLHRVMMSTQGASFDDYPWLGTLTQCVHPIEKRVLEDGWHMTFGWPDNLERWAAVEDGFYEGGTGRFSGTIEKDYYSAGLDDVDGWNISH